jgi:3-methyl-2-oxobutanoate hydroxymethyltransferase
MKTSENPVRIPDIQAKKARGEKIAMLTAYDATIARLLDRSGVDMLLVGDSLGMVVLGYETTLPVTMEDMVRHTQAVSRGASRALIVADMPFLSYHASIPDAVRNAGRLLQEGGAAAVKLEGGHVMAETVERLVSLGIPVVGHLGLQPQSFHQLGGFRRQATRPAEQERLLRDAHLLQQSGAFAIVLECIPDALAQSVTAQLTIPVIGIGSGPFCDGQVLVSNDILGLSEGAMPPFVKQYASLAETVVGAARSYNAEVRAGQFPAVKTHREPKES